MIKFTQAEIKFLNRYIKHTKEAYKLEEGLINIIEKYNLVGNSNTCGMLSNAEVDSAEEFENLINEFYEFDVDS